MVYTPTHFAVEDREVLFDHIERTGLALLIGVGAEGPLASHAPMLLERDQGANGRLVGHLAKANPHWQEALGDKPALAVFQGPDAYITPSWYASKQEHGRVVPTWNYAVVHARGPITFFEDRDRLHDVVSRLTDFHERRRAEPWAVTDAPERFVEAQLRGIVGFVLEIETLTGKYKMSQNRPAEDRDGVVAGLASEEGARARDTGDLVRAAAEGRFSKTDNG